MGSFATNHDGPNSVSNDALCQLVDLSSEGLCLIDPRDRNPIYANSVFWGVFGQTSDDHSLDWFGGDQDSTAELGIRRLLAREIDEAVFSIFRPDRDPIEIRMRRIEVGGRLLLGVRASRVERSTSDRDISHSVARVDPLTGLADRACLMKQLNGLLSCQGDTNRHCAVLFVDVDGFKQINDAHGHLVGDRVLCEVAQRLASCVRSGDLVARFGGDEFVVLVERVENRAEIQPMAERIHAAFDDPIVVADRDARVVLAVSIGIAECGIDGTTAEQLIHSADRAMYAAKQARADMMRPVVHV